MNKQAQLQIRLLNAQSNPAERQKLKKHLKPLPASKMPTRQQSEPVHIKTVLPEVMADIRQRMQRAEVMI